MTDFDAIRAVREELVGLTDYLKAFKRREHSAEEDLARAEQVLNTQLDTKLQPSDFRSLLYIVVREREIEITTRILFDPHEDTATMAVIKDGRPDNAAVFDRESGGEELYCYKPLTTNPHMRVGDICQVRLHIIRDKISDGTIKW